MAGKYLGEFDHKIIEMKSLEEQREWSLNYIISYGGIDGVHHKDWVLDQVIRIMHGTPVETRLARWDCGTEDLRFNTLEPTQNYHDYIAESCHGEDGPDTYHHNVGCPP